MLEGILFLVLFILVLLQTFQPFSLVFAIMLLIIQIGLIFWLWFRLQKKRKSNYIENNSFMPCNQRIIQILKIYRHDWLNHLQIILGYASLKKADQISPFIDKIIHQSKQLGLVSSFHHVNLATYLLMIPLDYPNLKVELEVADDFIHLEDKVDGEWMHYYIKSFLDIIHHSATGKSDVHQLFLSLAIHKEKAVVDIEIEGNVEQVYPDIQGLGEQLEVEGGFFSIDLFNVQELVMELQFHLVKRGV